MVSNYLKRAIKDKSKYITPHHLDKALSEGDINARIDAVRHPAMSSENVTNGIHDKELGVRLETIKHNKLNDEQTNHVIDNLGSHERSVLADKRDLKPEHIHRLLDKDEGRIGQLAVNTASKADHLHRMLKMKPDSMLIKTAVAKHSNTSTKDLHKFIDSGSYLGTLARENLKNREESK